MSDHSAGPPPLAPPLLRETLRELVLAQPRVTLGTWPTPLEPLSRLSRLLGGPRLYLKREDLTGLGLGGNKTRVLEFRLARALAQGCDCVLAGLDVRSNSARQLTAAAQRLGLDTYLILQGPQVPPDTGNLLLDIVLGAHLELLADPSEARLAAVLLERAARLKADGRRPYVMNLDEGFELSSSLAGILCALECHDQMASLGEPLDCVYLSSRGKGQSGFVFTSLATGSRTRTVGVAAAGGGGVARRTISIIRQVADILGVQVTCKPRDVESHEDFAGTGYGIPSAEGYRAILLLARTEGVILDPVYTGKAMAGCLEHVRSGQIPSEAAVVFVHSGESPRSFDMETN